MSLPGPSAGLFQLLFCLLHPLFSGLHALRILRGEPAATRGRTLAVAGAHLFCRFQIRPGLVQVLPGLCLALPGGALHRLNPAYAELYATVAAVEAKNIRQMIPYK